MRVLNLETFCSPVLKVILYFNLGRLISAGNQVQYNEIIPDTGYVFWSYIDLGCNILQSQRMQVYIHGNLCLALLFPLCLATLHLGCTPRRSSRSQRNNTPTCYLNPEKSVALSFPLTNLGNRVQGNGATNCSVIPQSSKLLTTPTMNSSGTYISYDNSVIKKNDSDNSKFPFSQKNLSPGVNHLSPSFSSSCSVYPLYNYGNSKFQLEDSNCKIFCKPNYSLMKADKIGVMEKHSSCGQDASSVLSQADPQHISETPPGSVCDLSLRLGPLAVPCTSAEDSWSQEVDDGALERCKVGSKANGLPSQSDKDFFLFPKANAHDMFDCSSTKWNHKTQNLDVKATLRKRKVAVSHQSDDRQLCWPLKVPFEKFNGRISNANQ